MRLIMKKLIPVRLIKNGFFIKIETAEESRARRSEILNLLDTGREKRGIFEGDLDESKLEIGQVSALLNKIESADEIIKDIIEEYKKAKEQLLKQR